MASRPLLSHLKVANRSQAIGTCWSSAKLWSHPWLGPHHLPISWAGHMLGCPAQPMIKPPWCHIPCKSPGPTAISGSSKASIVTPFHLGESGSWKGGLQLLPVCLRAFLASLVPASPHLAPGLGCCLLPSKQRPLLPSCYLLQQKEWGSLLPSLSVACISLPYFPQLIVSVGHKEQASVKC